MTVEQFKYWLNGFTEALQLDLVSGFDADDLDDVFNKVKEKLAEVEQHTAPTSNTPPINVPENLPHIPPTSPFGTHNPYPSRSPDVWYAHGTGVDRLNTWPGSSSTFNTKVGSEDLESNSFDPNRIVPRRG